MQPPHIAHLHRHRLGTSGWETRRRKSYTVKQKLQYLVFPDGILYDKENDTVRTERVNSLFLQIPLLARDIDENQKGNQVNDCLFGSNVGRTGFEPATPWSQTRYSTGLNYLPPCLLVVNAPKGLQK